MKSLTHALDATVGVTRLLSRLIVRMIGLALLVVVGLICAEVAMRKLAGVAIPGVHEYSGYLLAILSSWGLAHTLLERAHIRIDVVYGRLPPISRQMLDIIALLAVNLVAWTIALNSYPVLMRSIVNGSLANTSLATPLWIPQALWLAGYVWFALTTTLLGLRVLAALTYRDAGTIQTLVGMDEGELPAQEIKPC